MSATRPLLFAILAAALWAPAPAAQASELVKLAKLIVTGKRSPTVPVETKPLPPTAAPAAPAPKVEAAAPAAERGQGFEGHDGQDGPRIEMPRQDRGGGERVGGGPARPQVG